MNGGIKNMNKIIILVGLLTGVSCNQEDKNLEAKIQIANAIDHVQDMKEWMEEDIKQGMIKPEYGEYYVTWLEQSETILIEFHDELITD